MAKEVGVCASVAWTLLCALWATTHIVPPVPVRAPGSGEVVPAQTRPQSRPRQTCTRSKPGSPSLDEGLHGLLLFTLDE